MNFAPAREAGHRLIYGARAMDQLLMDLKNDINRLRAHWDGNAQKQYDEHQLQFDLAYARLKDVMVRLGTSVVGIVDDTQEQEYRLANLWSSPT
jgi:WXG100 family type VII secretion target